MRSLDTRELWAEGGAETWKQEAIFFCFLCVIAFLSRGNPDLDAERLLGLLAALMASNAVLHRYYRRLPGMASLISLGLNSLLLSYLLDVSGGRDSILWPLFLLPIFTAGLALPGWTLRVAGLETAILLCFYLQPLSDGEGLAAGELLFKAGFLLFSAWVVGTIGKRESRTRGKLRQSEEELRKLNTELERRVEERTSRLSLAMEELEAFNYSVSHDLRAPLVRICGFAGLLLSNAREKLDPETLDLLSRIERSASRMAQLIEDLLAFARLGRAGLKSVPLDMSALVREVAQELTGAANGRARLRVEELPPAWGDRDFLRQVWVNLLANALKFSRQAAEPRVEIGGRKEGRELIYQVKDNGVGFDPESAGKLFRPFSRLHSLKDFEGNGIGLATVQRIISRHGGKVWAESAPGQGAAFSFSLPADEPPAESSDQQATENPV